MKKAVEYVCIKKVTNYRVKVTIMIISGKQVKQTLSSYGQ